MTSSEVDSNDVRCFGYIQLVFFDSASNEVVPLGGAGFLTEDEDAAAWANVPLFLGESNFMADRMDANRDIFEDKPVSAETCERLMGKPVGQLIAEGRGNIMNKASQSI